MMLKFRIAFALLLIATFQLLASSSIAHAVPVNGDFSAGLTSWTADGDVTSAGGEAILSDTTQGCALCSRLYQGVGLATGMYTIEFDFLNSLSDIVPDFFAPDMFFASLYFANDLSAFDIDNAGFDAVTALLDADYLADVAVAGSLSASAKGAEWTHYTFSFQNNFNFVIPVFELIDFNGLTADSQFRIDNVTITAQGAVVPEPATVLLLLMGLGVVGVLSRKRQFLTK